MCLSRESKKKGGAMRGKQVNNLLGKLRKYLWDWLDTAWEKLKTTCNVCKHQNETIITSYANLKHSFTWRYKRFDVSFVFFHSKQAQCLKGIRVRERTAERHMSILHLLTRSMTLVFLKHWSSHRKAYGTFTLVKNMCFHLYECYPR